MKFRTLLLFAGLAITVTIVLVNALHIRNDVHEVGTSVSAIDAAGYQRLLVGQIGGRVVGSAGVGDPAELATIADQIRDDLDALSSLKTSIYEGGELGQHLPVPTADAVQAHYQETLNPEFIAFIAGANLYVARLDEHVALMSDPAALAGLMAGMGSSTSDTEDVAPTGPPAGIATGGGGIGAEIQFPPFASFISPDDTELAQVYPLMQRAMIVGLMSEVNASLSLMSTGLVDSIDEIEEDRFWFISTTIGAFAVLGVILYLAFHRPIRTMTAKLARLNQHLDAQVAERTSELNVRHAELKAIMDSAIDGIVAIDHDSNIVMFNPAAEQLFGYEATEVSGKNVKTLMPKHFRPQHDHAVRHYLETGERRVLGARAEVEGLRKDGSVVPIELSVNEVQLDTGSMFTAVIRDITERKEANERLLMAVKKAQAANKAKSEFLATMSHELRTPMNAIIGFSDLLANPQFGELNDAQQEFTETIGRSGRHLLGLINDVLDMSKVESGRIELKPTPTQVGNVVADSISEVQSLVDQSGVSISWSVSELDDSVLLDGAKIRQILVNLIGNAIKFTLSGGSVTVSATRLDAPQLLANENDVIRISVEDTGIGFEPYKNEKLFEPFYQGDSSYSRGQEGTGLGLPLSRRLARLHGGEINISSKGLGLGATAVVELPIRTAEEGAGPATTSQSTDPEAEGYEPDASSGPLALVVDEQPDVRLAISRMFSLQGFEVMEAADGLRALKLSRERIPTVITLDLMMPDMDGWAVLSELKSDPMTRHIPVIIISALDDPQISMQPSVFDYIVKPATLERIEQVAGRIKDLSENRTSTVLLIDDDPIVCTLVTNVLLGFGANTLTASTGEEGVRMATDERPDAIILDMNMPGMTGIEVMDRLQELPESRNVPIIFFTARDLTEEESEAISTAGHSVVVKAGDSMNLVRELARTGLVRPLDASDAA